jgi:ubiquitin-like protein Pup
MAMRIQIDRTRSRRRTESDEAPAEVAKVDPSASSQTLVGDMDDLLDEIDSIIEQNAEEFVANYAQE